MKKFINSYLNETKQLLESAIEKYSDDLIKISEKFKKTSKKGGKIILLGNGGSAATSSHVSVDLTKNAKIRSINFNEADLITCFSTRQWCVPRGARRPRFVVCVLIYVD